MKEKLKKIAELNKESANLVAEEKFDEAITKMQEASELANEVAEETAEVVDEAKPEEIEKTMKENIKKWADAYISGQDFADVLKQVIEASDLMKGMEAIKKEQEVMNEKIAKISDEEEDEQGNDPEKEDIEKSKDANSVWGSMSV